MHQHNHPINDPTHVHGPGDNGAGSFFQYFMGVNGPPATSTLAGGAPGAVINAMTRTAAAATGITINNAGGGSSQNVQPTIMLNKIIKT